jgi:hypothetical protein
MPKKRNCALAEGFPIAMNAQYINIIDDIFVGPTFAFFYEIRKEVENDL